MKTITAALVLATTMLADVRVNINFNAGHPWLNRPVRTVIVRRPPAVYVERVVYAPPVVWTQTIVEAPPRPRMVWEDNETFRRTEDWVDTHFKVANSGVELFLRISGKAQIDFAEVRFGNGQVQLVDFHDNTLQDGTFRLLDFAGVRNVVAVRMVARSRTPAATIAVLMRK